MLPFTPNYGPLVAPNSRSTAADTDFARQTGFFRGAHHPHSWPPWCAGSAATMRCGRSRFMRHGPVRMIMGAFPHAITGGHGHLLVPEFPKRKGLAARTLQALGSQEGSWRNRTTETRTFNPVRAEQHPLTSLPIKLCHLMGQELPFRVEEGRSGTINWQRFTLSRSLRHSVWDTPAPSLTRPELAHDCGRAPQSTLQRLLHMPQAVFNLFCSHRVLYCVMPERHPKRRNQPLAFISPVQFENLQSAFRKCPWNRGSSIFFQSRLRTLNAALSRFSYAARSAATSSGDHLTNPSPAFIPVFPAAMRLATQSANT